ncbi:MAG: 1-(5-phosphoribosyl)-5-[(5-phosphoribosylamino)methylideneamino]imidazole-4-carboxamide isomerase [Alphaproteobacteria bacterium]|nr:1-(5-phosphoribosyl)-5-[(5-phosphoribosylamino)methylideneamino]imidazole-4-carboxamide isomerase [Alphaproteobacteria bacterium]
MILYPAIDLKDGACVRLVRGAMESATVFSDDPAAQARAFAAAGAEWLHVVDLNGAIKGRPVNGTAVRAIVAAVGMPVQLGGGIRDAATIERWLASGVTRVILGTVAVRDPELVRRTCREHPGRIVVGIDARGGQVLVQGWTEASTIGAVELARRFEDAGVAAVIHTNIDHDGAMLGPDVAGTAALARAVGLPVIASGGVRNLADLDALKAEDVIAGVVVGRALYDGTLDLRAAIARLAA